MNCNYQYEIQELIELFSSPDPFPVDFELAWRWSGFASKYVAKKILLNSFLKEVDFVELKPKVISPMNGAKGYAKLIKINLDCWKGLALLANNSIGQRLRQDLIRCEKLIEHENNNNLNGSLLHLKKAIKENVLLEKVLSQWCDPLFKIRMAIEMLETPCSESKHSAYFEILLSSCFQLLELFENTDKLYEFTKPEKLQILQKFHLLEATPEKRRYSDSLNVLEQAG